MYLQLYTLKNIYRHNHHNFHTITVSNLETESLLLIVNVFNELT